MFRDLNKTGEFLHRRLVASLSGRLLFFTTLFVMLAEIFIYFPSAARQYHDLLATRLAAAQTAVLALESAQTGQMPEGLQQEMLANAGVRLVSLRRGDTERTYLADGTRPVPDIQIDLRALWWPELLADSIECMVFGGDRTISVRSVPQIAGGAQIDVIIDEAPVRRQLLSFTQRLFALSLIIALFTSGLVFASLYFMFVRPMQRVTQSMVRFQERPDDPTRIIEPTARQDEIGQAERVLAAMQGELRQALQSRAHLAALGMAVARIQHDLRNILSTAQLASDRLADSRDPAVTALAPRLIQSIDRAIDLATSTLKYGRADERVPNREQHRLLPLVEEAMHAALAAGNGGVSWSNAFDPFLTVDADGEQLLRILLNIGRNAVQALEGVAGGAVRVTARREDGGVMIDISDNGPGIPEAVVAGLFEPFQKLGRAGGTGLGLAIARELAQAHGGDVAIAHTSAQGTTFRIIIPPPPPPAGVEVLS